MDEEKKAARRTPDGAAPRVLVCNRPARHRLIVGSNMITSPHLPAISALPVAGGMMTRLRSLLTSPIRLERRGYDWHFVLAPPVRLSLIHI